MEALPDEGFRPWDASDFFNERIGSRLNAVRLQELRSISDEDLLATVEQAASGVVSGQVLVSLYEITGQQADFADGLLSYLRNIRYLGPLRDAPPASYTTRLPTPAPATSDREAKQLRQ